MQTEERAPEITWSEESFETLTRWANNKDCRVSAALTEPHYRTSGSYAEGTYRHHYETNIRANYADYFTIREDGAISYRPYARITDDHRTGAADPFAPAGRQFTKPGKFVRAALVASVLETLTDHDIEAFANRCKAIDVNAAGRMKIVSGPEITYWYHPVNVAEGQGSLNQSCMTDRNHYGARDEWFDIYADNPAAVRMLILTDEDNQLLLGRALVWTTDIGTVMDRAYGTDATISQLIAYGEREGWITRSFTPRAYGVQWTFPDGTTTSELQACVALDEPHHEHHPYLDSFRYLHAAGSTLYSYHPRHAGVLPRSAKIYELCDTSGGPSSEPAETCIYCDVEEDYPGQWDNPPMCDNCHRARACRYCAEEVTDAEAEAHELQQTARFGYIRDQPTCPACAARTTCPTCQQHKHPTDEYCQECAYARVCPHCRAVHAPGVIRDIPNAAYSDRACPACLDQQTMIHAEIMERRRLEREDRAVRERIVYLCPSQRRESASPSGHYVSTCRDCGGSHYLTRADAVRQRDADDADRAAHHAREDAAGTLIEMTPRQSAVQHPAIRAALVALDNRAVRGAAERCPAIVDAIETERYDDAARLLVANAYAAVPTDRTAELDQLSR